MAKPVKQNLDMSSRVSYRDLIKRVYIDPIRSAIVVDDTYPTLDSFLIPLKEGQIDSPELIEGKSGLSNIVKFCRERPKPWLIDVHNGSDLDDATKAESQFKRLHQSDLMILDYNLDGEHGGNEKCCNVLKSLATNTYFNLVIIYTACPENELLNRVLAIVSSLSFKIPTPQGVNRRPPSVGAWLDLDDSIERRLIDAMDLYVFLKIYHEKDENNWAETIRDTQLWSLLNSGRDLQVQGYDDSAIKAIINWIFISKMEEFSASMSDINLSDKLGKIEFQVNTDTNWIRTNSLFVTVIRKHAEGIDFSESLLNALHESEPSPHRLLMTKIRNVLDEKGIIAERNILAKKHMQAGWLLEMLTVENDDERRWKLKRTVSHHWEELANQVNDDVKDYAKDLFHSIHEEEQSKKHKVIQKYTSVNPSNKTEMLLLSQEWNSYVCSKEVDGHHLMTGHIFKIINNDQPEYWICLTPICDLVPRAGNIVWGGQSILNCDLIPFKAVKLEPQLNIKKIINDKIVRGDHIIIGSGTNIQCFQYSPQPNENPHWNQFFAHNSGRFGTDRKLKLSSISFSKNRKLKVASVEYEAELVTQLRYEYALNLLTKLGGAFARIGLDFTKHAV